MLARALVRYSAAAVGEEGMCTSNAGGNGTEEADMAEEGNAKREDRLVKNLSAPVVASPILPAAIPPCMRCSERLDEPKGEQGERVSDLLRNTLPGQKEVALHRKLFRPSTDHPQVPVRLRHRVVHVAAMRRAFFVLAGSQSQGISTEARGAKGIDSISW